MKALIGVLFMACSISAFTSTGETETFLFDGGDTEKLFTLNGEATHTEYRRETRAETCWRRVLVGYRRVCHTRYQRRCRNTPRGQVCRNIPRQVCRQVPRYRDQPYTCYREVRIPYEVHDHFVRTNFDIRFQEVPDGITPHEEFIASTYGNSFKLRAKSSGKLLIYAKAKTTSQQAEGLRIIDALYDISFLDTAKVFSPMLTGIQDLVVDKETLSFVTNQVTGQSPIQLHLLVKRVKKFSSNPKLINRNLNTLEYQMEQIGEQTRFTINLLALIPKRKAHKKHSYKVTLNLLLNEAELINKADLPKTSISKKVTLKIK